MVIKLRAVALSTLDTAELVSRFVELTLAQDESLLDDDISEVNRLLSPMWELTAELKSRAGDQRRALTTLYRHPNAQTRLHAAMGTLAVAPEEATRVLRKIVTDREFPQAADAAFALHEMEAGRFIPT
jgi:hypothetical protein